MGKTTVEDAFVGQRAAIRKGIDSLTTPKLLESLNIGVIQMPEQVGDFRRGLAPTEIFADALDQSMRRTD